jgi:long-chain acyl-CoA synthetase
MMTPITALNCRANYHPEETALITGNEVWTYRRLAAEVDRLARALLARGVRQGDRVALHVANRPELVIAYYACFRIGAIAAPLNTRFKTPELRPLLKQLRPVLYLGDAQLYPQIAPIEAAILAPDARYVAAGIVEDDWAQPWANLIKDVNETSGLHDCDIDAPAVLLATSGTTGQPKLVTHTPGTLSALADACVHLGFEHRQIAINTVPMVHGTGLSVLLACIRFGDPMILIERFDANSVLDAI